MRLPRVESVGLAGVGLVVLFVVGVVFVGDPALPADGAGLPAAEYIVLPAVAVRCPDDPYITEDKCPASTSPATSSTPPPSGSVPSSAPTTPVVAVTSTSPTPPTSPPSPVGSPVPTVPPTLPAPPVSVGIGEPSWSSLPPLSSVSVAPPPTLDSASGSHRSPVPERLSNISPAAADQQLPATGPRWLVWLLRAGGVLIASGLVCLLIVSIGFDTRRPW